MYANARDWARLGLLYLNDGKVGDQQIVSKDFIAFSKRQAQKDGIYGGMVWLNDGYDPLTKGRSYPNLPKDMGLFERPQWTNRGDLPIK